MDWGLFANVATVISSISVLFAIFSLVHEMKQQRWQKYIYLDERLATDLLNDARVTVREGKPTLDAEGNIVVDENGQPVFTGCLVDKPLVDWSAEDRLRANLICDSYSSVGLMLRSGFLDNRLKDFFLSQEAWGRSIIIQYHILEDFSKDLKKSESLYPSFEWLYREAKAREGKTVSQR